MTDKFEKLEKYYLRQKQKKYRNCGAQVTMISQTDDYLKLLQVQNPTTCQIEIQSSVLSEKVVQELKMANKENQSTQFVSPLNSTTKMNESLFDQESSIKTPVKNLQMTQESQLYQIEDQSNVQSSEDGNKFTNYLKDVTTKMENVL